MPISLSSVNPIFITFFFAREVQNSELSKGAEDSKVPRFQVFVFYHLTAPPLESLPAGRQA